jgi:hypothetical protein
MDFETIEKKVCIALETLRRNDSFLLEANTNERTISHKLAEYLQKEFLELSVDCEYNRHESHEKKANLPKDGISWDDIEAKTVFPDILVHKRDTDDSNLLIIEIKKSSNKTNRQFDKNKLIAFTMEPFNYNFGLFLEINIAGSTDSFEWYKNGRKYENQN